MKKIDILKKLINDRCYKLSILSVMCAICSRCKLGSLYKFFSRKRFDECRVKIEALKLCDGLATCESNNKKKTSCEGIIWTMWQQGYDNAPEIVKKAIDSKRVHSNGHDVIVIDKDNVERYVDVPTWMKEKVENGIISLAHFSDYVRSELLRKYGGLWIDSTVFVVDQIPEYIFEREFWSIHWENNRNWIASYDKWSVGVLASKPDSEIMRFCAQMEKEYWKLMDYPVTYLLLDMFISIYYDKNINFHNLIDITENNNTYIFNFVEDNASNGNKAFNEFEYSRMRKDTWIFKFTYKENYVSELEGQKTFFGKVLEDSLDAIS